MSNFKIWIDKDLGTQALDKMRRISDKDMPFYEACVYQVSPIFVVVTFLLIEKMILCFFCD